MNRLAMVPLVLALAGCVLREDETPPLTGPSEFGQSIRVSASPDVLPTDGISASLITVTARDAYGRPLRGLSLRGEVTANGVVVDLGRLAPQNVVTNPAGLAHLTFTAPLVAGRADTGSVVDIAVTPAGDHYAAAIARLVSIRLVPGQ